MTWCTPAATRVAIDRIDSKWKMTWSPMRLHVEWLRVGKIDARLPASEPNTPPAQMPATLELPLAIDIDTLTLGELSLLRGRPLRRGPLVLSGLSGAVHSDGQRHRIVIDRLVTPYGKLQANGQIAGRKTVRADRRGVGGGRWQDESYEMTARVDGSLETLHARVEANGDRIRARASADVTPFGEVPFTHLMVDGERINPRCSARPRRRRMTVSMRTCRPVAPARFRVSARPRLLLPLHLHLLQCHQPAAATEAHGKRDGAADRGGRSDREQPRSRAARQGTPACPERAGPRRTQRGDADSERPSHRCWARPRSSAGIVA
jgi:hypothetical protein